MVSAVTHTGIHSRNLDGGLDADSPAGTAWAKKDGRDSADRVTRFVPGVEQSHKRLPHRDILLMSRYKAIFRTKKSTLFIGMLLANINISYPASAFF